MDLVLDKDVQGDVSVDVSFAFGTTAAGDFTNTTQAFTFTGGTADTLTVTVPTVDDNVLETDETFFAYLALTAGNSEVDVTDTAIATIIDNDDATVTIADASVTEGGNILMDLVLDKDVQGDVSVDVSFAFGTTAAGDFTNTTQAFTFTGGTADTLTVTVPTVDDNVLETDETFFAYLALTAGNSEVDVTDTAIATIIDNDDATVTIADASVTEGGDILMDLVLDKDVQGDVSVDVSFAFGTTAAGDFTNTTQAFTFTGGTADTLTVTVPTVDDNVLETDETFFAYLALTAGNSEVDVTDTAIATIIDNDDATVTIDSITVDEDAVTATFTVTLTGNVQDAFEMYYTTSDISTLSGSDYNGVVDTLYYTEGATNGTSKEIVIQINDDSFVEATEEFIITLSADSACLVTITDTIALGTILDNDSATVDIRDVAIYESEGVAKATVILNGNVQDTFTIDFAVSDSTALAVEDYEQITSSVTFPPNSVQGDSVIINIPVVNDSYVEEDEYFKINIFNISGSSSELFIDTSMSVVTILNDDYAPTNADFTVNGYEDQELILDNQKFINAYNDQNNDELGQVMILSLPQNGTLRLNNTAVTVNQVINRIDLDNLKFIPLANWNGTTGFDYKVSDAYNWSTLPAKVTINIQPVNDIPVAIDDIRNINEDSELTINVLDNDSDVESTVLTVTGMNILGTSYPVNTPVTIPNVGTVIIHTNGEFTFSPVENFNGDVPVITYTISDGDGGKASARILITIDEDNDTPIVFNEEFEICNNMELSDNILDNGDYDVEMSELSVNVSLVNNTSTGTFSISPNGEFNYVPYADFVGTETIIIPVCDDQNSCTNDTLTIVVHDRFTLSAGDDVTSCGIVSVTISESVTSDDSDLNWISLGDGVFDNNNALHPVYTPGSEDIANGTVELILSGIGNQVCGAMSDTVVISFMDEIEIFAGNDFTACGLKPITLETSQASNNAEVIWTSSSDGSFNDATILHPEYSPGTEDIANGFAELIISGIGEQNCGTTTDTVVISFMDEVDIFAGDDLTTCALEPITLAGSLVSNNAEIIWTSSGDGLFDDATILHPEYNPGTEDIVNGFVELILTATGDQICGKTTDSIRITFVDEINVFAGEDETICSGEAYLLNSASKSSGVPVIWSTSGDGSFDDNTSEHPTYLPGEEDVAAGQVILSIEVNAESACGTGKDSVILTIDQAASVYAGEDLIVCNNSEVMLESATTENAAAIQWITDGKGSIMGEYTLTPTYIPAENENEVVNLILTANGNGTCSDHLVSDTVSIRFIQNLHVEIDGIDTVLYGETTFLSAEVTPFDGNYEYLWNPEELVDAQNSMDVLTSPLENNTVFSVTVTDIGSGCQTSDSITVVVNQSLDDVIDIRNGISPNGDGNNDIWYIEGIENYPDNEVIIYNRWGDEIIRFHTYDNEFNYWDGMNRSGERVPDGTYYYLIKFNGKKSYTGWVQVRTDN